MVHWSKLWVAVAATLAVVPLATAETPAGCFVQSDDSAIKVGNQYYVKERHPSGAVYLYIYGETNAADGLQTSYSPCGYNKPMLPPDNLIATFNTWSGF